MVKVYTILDIEDSISIFISIDIELYDSKLTIGNFLSR